MTAPRPLLWLIGHQSTRTWRDWGPRWQVLALRWTLVWLIAGPLALLAGLR